MKEKKKTFPINDIYEAESSVYDGPKKPNMVNLEINVPTDVSKTQKISRFWGEEIDFNFFLDIVSKDKCLEYYGYYYCLSNDQRLSVIPKTKIIHMPLHDMVPAIRTTLQTSMTQVKKTVFWTRTKVLYL